jgi:cytochrome P450 family 4
MFISSLYFLLDGLIFPKGCIVHIHPFDIHRDREQFPDPEKFDPDRFLPENTRDCHPFAYIPFSVGARNCIGG